MKKDVFKKIRDINQVFLRYPKFDYVNINKFINQKEKCL